MRFLVPILSAFLLAPLTAVAQPAPAAGAGGPGANVDLALVLAVDISYSMDPDEQAVQRQGYVEALNSSQVLEAIRNGALGRIAVVYVEWAGTGQGGVVADWSVIQDAASAKAFTDVIEAAPLRRSFRTSISGAMIRGAALLDGAPYHAQRRVIDISGDGPNNEGAPVVPTRAAVLAKGIGINGLPIMLKRPWAFTFDLPDLDEYYGHCVIGGPGAFLVPIHSKADFLDATREKLIQEVAGNDAPARLIVPVQAKPPVSCTIGEEMWQGRFDRYNEH